MLKHTDNWQHGFYCEYGKHLLGFSFPVPDTGWGQTVVPLLFLVLLRLLRHLLTCSFCPSVFSLFWLMNCAFCTHHVLLALGYGGHGHFPAQLSKDRQAVPRWGCASPADALLLLALGERNEDREALRVGHTVRAGQVVIRNDDGKIVPFGWIQVANLGLCAGRGRRWNNILTPIQKDVLDYSSGMEEGVLGLVCRWAVAKFLPLPWGARHQHGCCFPLWRNQTIFSIPTSFDGFTGPRGPLFLNSGTIIIKSTWAIYSILEALFHS